MDISETDNPLLFTDLICLAYKIYMAGYYLQGDVKRQYV
jgi:hypothetical protein